MKVLFATTNVAKIKKYKNVLESQGIELLTIKDLNEKIEVDESGKNAIENAQIKAKAYYEATKIPTIGMDNCLYIEKISEEKQPGTHVRRVNGKELTDDEMIEHYTNLVKENGQDLIAKWVYGLAVCSDKGIQKYTWSYEQFYLTDKVCEKRNEGYPLDSISVIPMFNKYLVELTDDEKKQSLKEDKSDAVEFILNAINNL